MYGKHTLFMLKAIPVGCNPSGQNPKSCAKLQMQHAALSSSVVREKATGFNSIDRVGRHIMLREDRQKPSNIIRVIDSIMESALLCPSPRITDRIGNTKKLLRKKAPS